MTTISTGRHRCHGCHGCHECQSTHHNSLPSRRASSHPHESSTTAGDEAFIPPTPPFISPSSFAPSFASPPSSSNYHPALPLPRDHPATTRSPRQPTIEWCVCNWWQVTGPMQEAPSRIKNLSKMIARTNRHRRCHQIQLWIWCHERWHQLKKEIHTKQIIHAAHTVRPLPLVTHAPPP